MGSNSLLIHINSQDGYLMGFHTIASSPCRAYTYTQAACILSRLQELEEPCPPHTVYSRQRLRRVNASRLFDDSLSSQDDPLFFPRKCILQDRIETPDTGRCAVHTYRVEPTKRDADSGRSCAQVQVCQSGVATLVPAVWARRSF